MNIDQVKEYVSTQLKSYRVSDIISNFSDKEWLRMHKQISGTKPWEVERRLIDYAVMELDRFRYVLYTERHYEDLLIDKACIECLKCTAECETERRYYVRRPQS
jgi:ferredoxin